MSNTEHKLYQEGDRLIIERLTYPRFKGVVTFGALSDIEEVTFIDQCKDVMEIARAMREAGDYIVNNNKK